jgi:hypothetical protein
MERDYARVASSMEVLDVRFARGFCGPLSETARDATVSMYRKASYLTLVGMKDYQVPSEDLQLSYSDANDLDADHRCADRPFRLVSSSSRVSTISHRGIWP